MDQIKNRELTREEKKLVEENYGLSILSQKPFPRGNIANTVLITTNRGAFVVKAYFDEFSRELIDFQARVCNHLHQDGLPTPIVYENRQGAFVTPLGELNCILMNLLPGEHPAREDPGNIRYFLETLATASISLEKFGHDKAFQLHRFSTPIKTLYEEMKAFLPATPKNQIDEFVLGYAERLHTLVEACGQRISSIDFSELIFGDFNLESILVNGGEVSGLIDFDFMQRGKRAYDVIHIMDLLVISGDKGGAPLDQMVNWEKLGRCMQVYSKNDPGISEQIEIFPLMLQYKRINDVIAIWKKGYDPSQPTKNKEYFSRKYGFFVPRVEIATQFEEKIISTLKSAILQ